MKDDRVCEYCTYKNVPTQFSPCLGCVGNMDHLIQKREESKNEPDELFEHDGGRLYQKQDVEGGILRCL